MANERLEHELTLTTEELNDLKRDRDVLNRSLSLDISDTRVALSQAHQDRDVAVAAAADAEDRCDTLRTELAHVLRRASEAEDSLRKANAEIAHLKASSAASAGVSPGDIASTAAMARLKFELAQAHGEIETLRWATSAPPSSSSSSTTTPAPTAELRRLRQDASELQERLSRATFDKAENDKVIWDLQLELVRAREELAASGAPAQLFLYEQEISTLRQHTARLDKELRSLRSLREADSRANGSSAGRYSAAHP